MLYRYRFVFLIGFLVLVGILVAIAEHYLSRSRVEFVNNLVQKAYENIAFEYDLSFDVIQADPASSPDSSSVMPSIPTLPQDPNIQHNLKNFPGMIQALWKFATDQRERYQQYDLTGLTPTRKNDEQEIYDFAIAKGRTIHLNFLGAHALADLSIQSEEHKRSVSISYHPNGQPHRLLFGMWSQESMGIHLTFHKNGMVKDCLFLYQSALLGPAVIWNEDGTIQESDFFQRPKLLTINKTTP